MQQHTPVMRLTDTLQPAPLIRHATRRVGNAALTVLVFVLAFAVGEALTHEAREITQACGTTAQR